MLGLGAEAALLVLLGAVAFLDQWPALQTMLSRPLVVGTATGLVLGAPGEGAFWGAVFEAVYLGVLPVGAARIPDVGLGALVGTTVAVTGTDGLVVPAGYAVTAALVAGRLGEWVGRIHRRWNGRAAVRVRERVAAGDPEAPGGAVAAALARGAALGAAQAAVALTLGLAGLALVAGTAWSGPVPMTAVRLAAAAACAVAGLRVFGTGRARGIAWGTGCAVGAVLAWGGAG